MHSARLSHLQPLLNNAAKAHSYQAKESGVELIIEAPNDGQIVSDHDVLMLILQNLISNAIKYGGKGKVRLIAETVADGRARISVLDDGPGIEPGRLASLFAPFTRGETHGQAGNGLGLTIARQAADLLGASLHAESKPGAGTAFHLELPAPSTTA